MLDSASSFTAGAELRIDTIGYDQRGRPDGYVYTVPSIAGWTDTNGLAGAYAFDQYSWRRDDQLASLRYPALGNMPAEVVTTDFNAVGSPVTLVGSSSFVVVGQTTFTNRGEVAGRVYGALTDQFRVERSYAYDVVTGRQQGRQAWINGVMVRSDWASFDAAGNTLVDTHQSTTVGASHTECFAYNGRNQSVAKLSDDRLVRENAGHRGECTSIPAPAAASASRLS